MWHTAEAPPEDMIKVKVTPREYRHLMESIQPYSRMHYNMGGKPNILKSNIVWYVDDPTEAEQ